MTFKTGHTLQRCTMKMSAAYISLPIYPVVKLIRPPHYLYEVEACSATPVFSVKVVGKAPTPSNWRSSPTLPSACKGESDDGLALCLGGRRFSVTGVRCPRLLRCGLEGVEGVFSSSATQNSQLRNISCAHTCTQLRSESAVAMHVRWAAQPV